MDVRILNLDGALTAQERLFQSPNAVHGFQSWGPRIRMACSFDRFRQFEQALTEKLGRATDDRPHVTFYGSGDFHHVSLALVRRLREPFNLLVLDNHPDWMRGVPFLHCGTWLRHASLLPMARRVFHVGGEVDFDNGYRWMAPWRQLREGQIAVIPGYRRFDRGAWAKIECEPLRPAPLAPCTQERMEQLIRPFRDELGRRPLYVSLDKDVMEPAEAVVNWDSGRLAMSEVRMIINAFTTAAQGRLTGMDVVGDWSPVRVQGGFRQLLHFTEHPSLPIDPDHARRVNEQANLQLIADSCGILRQSA